jgi:aspartate ammonia-lyase
MRIEHDDLGEVAVPEEALWGVHTARALANFPLAGRPVHPALVRAFGVVKLACAKTNRELGAWADAPAKADAIEAACREMADGGLLDQVPVDAMQGGAGTSTNLCVDEVLANRALAILGRAPGTYDVVSPLDDLNLHQSTNDTYPTALRVAAIRGVRTLDGALVALQESFQVLEKRFADVVKVGRTQYQDAVLTTLGREMGAYAEAFNRDRWRVYKCEERLRVVNLGGTAIGTGLGAPRRFIFTAVEILRQETGIGLARAENLVEATQNADVFAEVSGILKACATSLWKVSSDLRLLSSGPDAGYREIRLPPLQAGSSIMPGKVNPVVPEAVTQAAMKVMANDVAIGMAVANGSLELNPFLPLVADLLLESLDLLARSADLLRRRCVEGIVADEARCRGGVEIATATVTALVPVLGYERAAEVARIARTSGRTVRHVATAEGGLTHEQFDALVSPEAVRRLGMPEGKSSFFLKPSRETEAPGGTGDGNPEGGAK